MPVRSMADLWARGMTFGIAEMYWHFLIRQRPSGEGNPASRNPSAS
jgi:hypothetical protein